MSPLYDQVWTAQVNRILTEADKRHLRKLIQYYNGYSDGLRFVEVPGFGDVVTKFVSLYTLPIHFATHLLTYFFYEEGLVMRPTN